MQFRAVLDSKGLGDVLAEQPAGGEESAASSQTGEVARGRAAAQDRQAKGLVVLAVDDMYQPLVDECGTAREAWVKLENLHAGNSKARKAALAREWA
eukprot:54186-Pelagomonas_calceolata.AAC.1